VELIAHRAGNLADLVGPAAEACSAIEVDVHLFRNRLEVRHAKILLWPLGRLWEKWELMPADAPRPTLDEIMEHVPDEVHVWFDLKGFTTRLPRAVHRAVGDRAEVTYSCRSWWVLGWVRRHTTARTMRSVATRWQRWLVVRLRAHGPGHGVAIHERLLHDDWIARLRDVTPTVIAWGVHDRARAEELRDAGVAGLILDDLELIRTLRHSG
jgi:glycerophosphoryl diester phosphodiesterase